MEKQKAARQRSGAACVKGLCKLGRLRGDHRRGDASHGDRDKGNLSQIDDA